MPLLVSSDDPTNLTELLIPQRLCVAGRVPVGDKGGPLLEGRIQEAQVRVVLSLGVLSRGALGVSLRLVSVLETVHELGSLNPGNAIPELVTLSLANRVEEVLGILIRVALLFRLSLARIRQAVGSCWMSG